MTTTTMTTTMTNTTISQIDDDILILIFSYLDHKSTQSILCINKRWNALGQTQHFWKALLFLHETSSSSSSSLSSLSLWPLSHRNEILSPTTASKNEENEEIDFDYKHIYIKIQELHSPSIVSWRRMTIKDDDDDSNIPSARFGHNMIRLFGNNSRRRRRSIVLTGGYVYDTKVHVLDMPWMVKSAAASTALSLSSSSSSRGKFVSIQPSGQIPPPLHGSTLTAIDDKRMIQFGGFNVDGDGLPTNDIYLLTIDDNEHNNNKKSAHWELIRPKGQGRPRPRGYHTATLLYNRLLVILGGVRSHDAVMDVDVLDIESWHWETGPTVSYWENVGPRGRGGHSVVYDVPRNRLVMFGSPTSGVGVIWDRSLCGPAEVWELQLGNRPEEVMASEAASSSSSLRRGKRKLDAITDKIDDASSSSRGDEIAVTNKQGIANVCFPWKWNRIDNPQSQDNAAVPLNFGHNAIQTSSDSVLFCFGAASNTTITTTRHNPYDPIIQSESSSSPIFKYSLVDNTFTTLGLSSSRRTTLSSSVSSPQENERSLAACVSLLEDGIAIFHGGRSRRNCASCHDILILDLAPCSNGMMMMSSRRRGRKKSG